MYPVTISICSIFSSGISSDVEVFKYVHGVLTVKSSLLAPGDLGQPRYPVIELKGQFTKNKLYGFLGFFFLLIQIQIPELSQSVHISVG